MPVVGRSVRGFVVVVVSSVVVVVGFSIDFGFGRTGISVGGDGICCGVDDDAGRAGSCFDFAGTGWNSTSD